MKLGSVSLEQTADISPICRMNLFRWTQLVKLQDANTQEDLRDYSQYSMYEYVYMRYFKAFRTLLRNLASCWWIALSQFYVSKLPWQRGGDEPHKSVGRSLKDMAFLSGALGCFCICVLGVPWGLKNLGDANLCIRPDCHLAHQPYSAINFSQVQFCMNNLTYAV